jgi:hypothetical protein
MHRPSAEEMPAWYHPYLSLVGEDLPPGALLAQSWQEALPYWRDQSQPEQPYAPGKWNLLTLVQHIIDTERIFQYRALQVARGDGMHLPEYDHEAYARATEPVQTNYALLLEEWAAVRQAGVLLFHSFSQETLRQEGQLKKSPVTLRAMAYIMVGHARHHQQVVAG